MITEINIIKGINIRHFKNAKIKASGMFEWNNTGVKIIPKQKSSVFQIMAYNLGYDSYFCMIIF